MVPGKILQGSSCIWILFNFQVYPDPGQHSISFVMGSDYLTLVSFYLWLWSGTFLSYSLFFQNPAGSGCFRIPIILSIESESWPLWYLSICGYLGKIPQLFPVLKSVWIRILYNLIYLILCIRIPMILSIESESWPLWYLSICGYLCKIPQLFP